MSSAKHRTRESLIGVEVISIRVFNEEYCNTWGCQLPEAQEAPDYSIDLMYGNEKIKIIADIKPIKKIKG